jgi:taurine dioxygenase
MTITAERWTTTPLNGSFGVAFEGSRLDIDRDGAWVLDQLEANRFVVLRGQFLTHGEQVALARAIGEPTPAHPVVPGHPDHPEILELDGAKGGKNAQWHTDVTFSTTPPAASVLVADRWRHVVG